MMRKNRIKMKNIYASQVAQTKPKIRKEYIKAKEKNNSLS
jgi:hypothetical protein